MLSEHPAACARHCWEIPKEALRSRSVTDSASSVDAMQDTITAAGDAA